MTVKHMNTIRHHHIYIYIHVCIYIYMYVCMYVCMYVRTYVCMYLSMYVCMYVRTYVRMYAYRYDYIYIYSIHCTIFQTMCLAGLCDFFIDWNDILRLQLYRNQPTSIWGVSKIMVLVWQLQRNVVVLVKQTD